MSHKSWTKSIHLCDFALGIHHALCLTELTYLGLSGGAKALEPCNSDEGIKHLFLPFTALQSQLGFIKRDTK